MGESEVHEMGERRCTIEILTNGHAIVRDTEGTPLQRLRPDQLIEKLKGATIKNVEVTPLSTYLETNSGVIIINGVAYYIG